MILGERLKYLSGILASKLIEIYLEKELRVLGKRSVQYSKQYLLNTFIITCTPQQALEIELLVDKILSLPKIGGAQNEILSLEKEIDEAVYRLYDLSPDEIALVEGR